MSPQNSTSEPSDTDSTVPPAVEMTIPAEETYAFNLCEGNYANIIVDLKNTEDLNPEIRVYPIPGADADAERVVIPLPEYDPVETAQPVVTVSDAEQPTSFSIQLPVNGELVDIVTVDVTEAIPHVTVTVPNQLKCDSTQTYNPAFNGPVVPVDPST